MSYEDRIEKVGPKKLLACDGGGIRGIISIEILAKIEAELRNSSKNPNLVLSDYFDYIAGTSTGAIIATLVALGKSTDEIREFYLDCGADMFEKARLWERFKTKFRSDNLTAMIKKIVGERTSFGSSDLKSLLMIVLRNATTDSPWPLSNNPKAKYNRPGVKGSNAGLPLWQLVRASTAAPTYFPPEEIVVGEQAFIFVDGGMTMFNCPAFQLFLMATSDPYNLCWETGEDKMLIVSVGTGATTNPDANLSPSEMHLLYNASSAPGAFMAAALHEQDFLCRVFGKCLVGGRLDREVEDMIGKGIPSVPKAFTYLRYNTELSKAGLVALGLPNIPPEHVQQMDSVGHIREMREVGKAVAEKRVEAQHFAGFPV